MTTPSREAGRARAGSSARNIIVLFTLAMCGLLLAVAIPTILSADRQVQNATRLTTMVGPAVDANVQIRTLVSESAAVLRGDGDMAAVALAVARGEEESYLALERLEGIVRADDYDDSPVTRERMETQVAAQRAALEQWWGWAGAGSRDVEEPGRLYGAVLDANIRVGSALQEDRAHLREATRVGSLDTSTIVLVATGLALGLALLASFLTVRALTRPIADLRDSVRRQREGHRDAWGRVDAGARELRELAADVNALTASHLSLLDDQDMRLGFERAEAHLSRRIRDADSRPSAVRLTVQTVADRLAADHVVGLLLDETRRPVEWVDSRGSRPDDGPVLTEEVAQLVAETAGSVDVDEGQANVEVVSTDAADGSLLVVPIGLRDGAVGLVIVHDRRDRQEWREAELGFLEGAAEVLARFLVEFEVKRSREEHVRSLEELDRLKDAFLSTVSHELRTPLTSIRGYLEMLLDGDAGDLAAEQKTMLGVIDRNAVRLRGLIEDLLVVTRIQTDGGSAGRDEVDLGSVLAEAVAQARVTADSEGVELNLITPGEVRVRGHRADLTRAFSNVVANAVKFTPAGGRVDLEAAVDAQSEAIRVICTDTGIGIPADELPRLSERFFRASNAADAQIPGTGLGLAIVRAVVENHGGELLLESTEDVGTTVTVALPAHS